MIGSCQQACNIQLIYPETKIQLFFKINLKIKSQNLILLSIQFQVSKLKSNFKSKNLIIPVMKNYNISNYKTILTKFLQWAISIYNKQKSIISHTLNQKLYWAQINFESQNLRNTNLKIKDKPYYWKLMLYVNFNLLHNLETKLNTISTRFPTAAENGIPAQFPIGGEFAAWVFDERN